MRKFLLLCSAQMLSVAGTTLTGFGLGIWLFQHTGSTTIYGWMALATLAPGLLLSPLAGALVDRWSPRVALLVGHLGAGLCSLGLVLLVGFGAIGVATTLALTAVASVFNALHFPALSAATTALVPREMLGRANGGIQLGTALGQISVPALGGMLITAHGLRGLLIIDLLSYTFVIGTLLLLHIPRSAPTEKAARPSIVGEIAAGWQYIRARPGFLRLLVLVAVGNFNLGVLQVLVTPLVLGFADARVLGVVMSVGGIGMLAGSVALLVWGGPRRRVAGIVGFLLLQCSLLFLGGMRPSAALVAVGAFGILFAVPFVGGCSQTIWQRKVPLDLQGRVFSIRIALAQSTGPLAFLLVGPLTDRVFEPAMAPGGRLASTAGALLGVGRGRGGALLLLTLGVLSIAAVLLCVLSPRLRRIEEELPDHTPLPAAPG